MVALTLGGTDPVTAAEDGGRRDSTPSAIALRMLLVKSSSGDRLQPISAYPDVFYDSFRLKPVLVRPVDRGPDVLIGGSS